MSDKKNKRKINKKIVLIISIISLLAIMILTGLGIGIYYWSTMSTGWYDINTNYEYNDEFDFNYNLVGSRADAKKEYKIVSEEYNKLLKEAYELYDSSNLYGDLHNIAFINNNLNQEIEVSEELYNSFKLFLDNKNKEFYLGPLFELNRRIYNSKDLDEAKLYNYFSQKEVNELYNSIYSYKGSNDITLDLLDNNKIKLNVSDNYLELIKKNNIKNVIDFGYLKNAFIVDYIADSLIKNNHNNGYIISDDGYLRAFKNNISYNYSVYDYRDNNKVEVANAQFIGFNAVRVFKYNENSYVYSSDEVACDYFGQNKLDTKLTSDSITCYSNLKCSYMLIKMDGLMYSSLNNYSSLSSSSIYTIYVEGNNVKYNGNKIRFNMILNDDKYQYNGVQL